MEGTQANETLEEAVRHLGELRGRLIKVALWFLVLLAAGLYAAPDLLLLLKGHPFAVPVVWNVFSLTDGLFIYMRCAFLVAAVGTLPVLLYQIWAFVRPGLTPDEARGSLLYVPVSFALFIVGLAFGYFGVFPMMVGFLQKMNLSIGAVETYGIDRYFSFLFNVVIPVAVAFEMPLVAVFLTRIGVLTPERLRRTRKYAYLALAITGSCISPPDFVSHLSVTVPLILLFEISVFVSAKYYGRRLAPAAGR
ncbi:Sec-independent protein translocase protein TatCy [Paenibacillus sp. J31TS4]|uniref:twin-arginine translocase subunit TatC n=1 Tax=Paenibacillus sp. J31TS4 TaxID=2807195 RepID=UPI001B13B540|nr:twin-arginine translocase subunit TatC [Paenibacillus sp. J31TS4]GIP40066.1 Sec-independent protein translocase protein TatCy [Paenibacillus sp. J31TS4]